MPDLSDLVFGRPWAIQESVLRAICAATRAGERWNDLGSGEVKARMVAAPFRSGQRQGGVIAVLPLYGIITQHPGFFTGASTEGFSAALNQVILDRGVTAVVLDIDSPGGLVQGIPELASEMRVLREIKPIVAVANSAAASAAYWLASSASQVSVTPSGEVGSIGVFSAHTDISGLQEKAGIKTTLVSSGKKKAWGNPYEPLSYEARYDIQERVNQYYQAFVEDVAQGRKVSVSEVRNGFGEGRMVGAAQAVRLRMADRVETLSQTLSRLSGQPSSGARAQARYGMSDDEWHKWALHRLLDHMAR